jgi:hypothetical protein
LGVARETEGTYRLQREYALEPAITAASERAHAKSRDAQRDRPRRQKIAAARRGKPRPRLVVEAMAAAKRGKPLSAATRRKMSEAHKRRATRPPKAGRPWTAQEDEAVRALPAKEAARRTGRPLCSVYTRRRQLKVPDGRAGRTRTPMRMA